MERLDDTFMLFQSLQCVLVLAWLGLSAAALVSLRKRPMSDVARVLWATLIVAIPLLGAAAFWIVRPGEGAGGAG